MTLEKMCSDTEIFLALSGDQPETSSTRGKFLTTELPRFLLLGMTLEQTIFKYVTSHEILGPNEVPGRNWDFDIFWYIYVSGVYLWNFSSIS